MRKSIQFFLFSVATLLLITATGKFLSSFGTAIVLKNLDPLFYISFRSLFRIVASLEVAVAVFLFLGKNANLKCAAIAFLSTDFLLYRLGLFLVGYHKPCSCMGSLTEMLHIDLGTADTIMKVILAYLLIGSYGILFWQWRQKRAQTPAAVIGMSVSGH
jgi:hypothetical protein